jgi:CubicO group peptidase (beta-lactamase class C family)
VTSLVDQLDAIQSRLHALARMHNVPGATLAVSQGDVCLEFATGVVNRNTGVETTTDSLFQIGSNTKIMTTVLVLQLVDSGDVALDAPVRRYIPTFALAKPGAEQVTLRHLLTHTSGMQGDYFEGFGRGDDSVGRYVHGLKRIDFVHRPGQMWSYCNSGFVVAGHVVERVTGLPFHQLLAERICKPLELQHTTVLIEEMISSRCAVGHVVGPDKQPRVPRLVVMEAAHVPAGSRTVSTAAELVRFTRMLLAGGTTPDGARILSEKSARAMEEIQVERPSGADNRTFQGIGWRISDLDGRRLIGHGGGTIGQLSVLEAFPELDLVVVLLTNSTTGGALWEDLGDWLFDNLAGVHLPKVPKAADPVPELDLEAYAGVYERLGLRCDVTAEGDHLAIRIGLSGPIAELQGGPPPPPADLRPVNRQSFAAVVEGERLLVTFLEFRRGRPGYLIFGGRVCRRTRARSRA